MKANAAFLAFGAAGGSACALGICLAVPPLWDWAAGMGGGYFALGLLLVGALVGLVELALLSRWEARLRRVFQEHTTRLFDAVPPLQSAAVASPAALERLKTLPAAEAPLTGAGGPADPQQLARPLVELAISQRAKGDYSSAVASLERALMLSPDAAEAHLCLGQTLSYHAAELQDDSEAKGPLLDRAEQEVRRALELDRGLSPDALHDLAWIYDERGDFENAARLYREGRAAMPPNAAEEDPALPYNLACTLAKSGRGGEALTELEKSISTTWEWAEHDEDLEILRRSPKWKRRFAMLIESAKRGAAGPATSASS